MYVRVCACMGVCNARVCLCVHVYMQHVTLICLVQWAQGAPREQHATSFTGGDPSETP